MASAAQSGNLENEPSNENRRSTVTIKSSSPMKLGIALDKTLRWKKTLRVLIAVGIFLMSFYLTYYAYDLGYTEGLEKACVAVDRSSVTSNKRPFRFHPRLELLVTEFLLAVAFVFYFFGFHRHDEVHDSSCHCGPDVSLIIRATDCILSGVDYEPTNRLRRFTRIMNLLNSMNARVIRNARNRDGFIVRPD